MYDRKATYETKTSLVDYERRYSIIQALFFIECNVVMWKVGFERLKE